MSDKIQLQWDYTMRLLRVPGEVAGKAYEELHALYTEPHRTYHNLTHIQACLTLAGSLVPGDALARVWLDLAIWYHDAIYDPKASDNEARSAVLFQRHADTFGIGEDASRVVQAIHATKHNQPADTRVFEVRYMLDVDLSILGEDPAVFDAYDRAIRSEYDWVPEKAYRNGRAHLLGDFLSRERIYKTEAFHERFDRQARLNLQRAMDRLRAV